MHPMFVLASMTVTEFKLFKRAYRILLRSGVESEEAIHILLGSHVRKSEARLRRV